jgi:hypothetical protein
MAKHPGKRKKDGAKVDATEGLPPLNLHAAGLLLIGLVKIETLFQNRFKHAMNASTVN